MTRTPACYAAATKHTAKLPTGRATKLYLPLCTPQEFEDAHLAELWLRTHCHPNRPWPPIAVRLIERYGELFEAQRPRQLRCRQCLGLRYGEVKHAASSMGGRGSRRAARHKRLAVQQEPHPPAKRRPTEQSLFLSNLPKLLAKPTSPPPLPKAEDRGEGSAQGRCAIQHDPSHGDADPSPQPAPTGRAGKKVDALSHADKEKLYLLFTTRLPSFKKLGIVKEQSEHDA